MGDGKTDDFAAIKKAHDHANTHNLPVRAKDTAAYYIGGGKLTVSIMTDTHFGKAKFIIDDRSVESRITPIFEIKSRHKRIRVKGIKSLSKSQTKVAFKHDLPTMWMVTDRSESHYIRKGGNANSGKAKKDVILVSKDGGIDKSTPLLWDFAKVTGVVALPIDQQQLVVSGGHFTTIANQEKSEYNYYRRGINVMRSNVLIKNMQHAIEGEGKIGAPYGGFFNISTCAYVKLQDCKLSSHKAYKTTRNSHSVTMGTYDLSINSAIHVTLERCTQLNSIHDTSRWGIMGSNYCKNLTYKDCELSRFDAHCGVYNATIDGCKLGCKGITVTGFGKLKIIDTEVHSNSFITLRPDYGSFWNGDIEIRNSKFIPRHKNYTSLSLITGRNTEDHNFGYATQMPHHITIDGLYVDDSKHSKKYRGIFVLGNLNPKYSLTAKPKFPYTATKSLTLKNITTASKCPITASGNKLLKVKMVNVK